MLAQRSVLLCLKHCTTLLKTCCHAVPKDHHDKSQSIVWSGESFVIYFNISQPYDVDVGQGPPCTYNFGSWKLPASIRVPNATTTSLVCANSYKLLKNTILIGSHVVDHEFAMLHQLGGELYRPSSTSFVFELMGNEAKRLLSYRYALPISDSRFLSMMVFDVEKLGCVSSFPSCDPVWVSWDFVGAIENANKTDLVTSRPLDLKSADMIPPQD